jgi:uncharacterized protein YukE
MEQSHILNLMFCNGHVVPGISGAAYLTDYSVMTDGQLVVVNDQNLVLDASTVLTNARATKYGIRIAGRRGTKLVFSDLIKADDVISMAGILTAAAAEQVTYIGYTGSGNSIALIQDNVYKLNIQVDQLGRTGRGNPTPIDVMYRSDASGSTATSVAFGIMGNLQPSLNKQPESTIVARLINSAAVTAGHQFDHNVAVVQGSKYVTVTSDLITHDTVHTAVVGDLVRLGTATLTNGATALGSPVYKIIAIDTLTLELDRPVTSVTGAYTADANAELIPIAAVGDYGIRLDGVAPSWVLGKRPWNKYTFTVGLTDFGATAVTYSVVASLGKGLINQMKDLEFFCEGESGNKYRGDFLNLNYTTQATDAAYDQIAIVWASKNGSEGISGPGHNPKQLILALGDGYAHDDAADLIDDILKAYTSLTTGLAAT